MHEVERRIGELAAAQDNVLTRAQLLEAGLRRGGIAHRAGTGQLQRIFGAVYLLGYAPPTRRQRLRAALLLGGLEAVLSHRTAGELLQLLPPDPGQCIHLTVSAGGPRSRPGLRVHRSGTLQPEERRERAGLAMTSAARTVCDLAATEPAALAQAALTEALVHGHAGPLLAGALARHPAAARVRRFLAAEQEHGYTRSEAERRLRSLLRGSGLPMPRFNQRVNGHLVDCHWPRERLVLEIDGFATHSSRSAFEGDRRRDQDHASRGYRVIRITWRQLTTAPGRVLVVIAQALVAD